MASTKRTRIADIAKQVGVSTATVSRALSGGGYVRDDVAARIRTAALEMNYRVPQNLIGHKVLLAASHDAMIDFQRSQFTMYVLEGLRDRAQKLNIQIENYTFQSSDPNSELRDKVASDDFLGVLLLTVDDALLDFAQNLACPVTLVNGDDPEMLLSSVSPCNRSAAAMATKHLVDLNHERILFLTKSGRRTIQRRQEGWQDVMGARFDPNLVVEAADWTAEAAQIAIHKALKDGLEFTGVVAAGDILAAGALVALNQAGFKVPDDMSVIGIDGLPQGEYLSPPLTSVAIPMQAVGALSLDLICESAKYLETDIRLPVRRIELACKLAPRETTGKNKGG
ncbi:LacI family DNA-binding transcriptional regulator [Actibacterium lipolyticum]|uniref:HTH-type transcriptional regulator GalS n=1 Tax=Actibacterium lipolyticum TaxID=1524263 RepID=A0A238L9T1_9RHOB|nr:LacI family DNA-binding transcriptional regulator [Actibacterium lipolyticum]SMX51112.1 HTH-type transcriptional regulator GalS [Actibacterium lipolyticum]